MRSSMTEEEHPVSKLIAAMGGPRDIEERTTIPAGRVAVWKHRKCIPRDAWPALLTNYPEAITLADLIAADPSKGAPSKKADAA
jgi:hypothetical protein